MPTLLESIRKNPGGRWQVRKGVPCFKAHVRQCPDGQVIQVNDSDLARIAQETNRKIESSGNPMPLMIGHRNFQPNAREMEQPPISGWTLNYRVETVKPPQGQAYQCLVYDEYTGPDVPTISGLYTRFPYRSVEYDPILGLAGVAALARPPYFPDLPAVLAYAAEAQPAVPSATGTRYSDEDLAGFGSRLTREEQEARITAPPLPEAATYEQRVQHLSRRVKAVAGARRAFAAYQASPNIETVFDKETMRRILANPGTPYDQARWEALAELGDQA